MSTDAFAKMAEYFESLVQEMKSEARQAGLLQNTTAVGTGREEIFRRLLERHLPDNCEVFRGGYVFNVEGETSRQIDVIATSGPTPRFEILPNLQAIAPVIVYLTQRDGRFTIDTCEYRLALLPSCAAVDYWRGHPSYLVCPDMWTMADGGFGYCPLWIEELLWL